MSKGVSINCRVLDRKKGKERSVVVDYAPQPKKSDPLEQLLRGADWLEKFSHNPKLSDEKKETVINISNNIRTYAEFGDYQHATLLVMMGLIVTSGKSEAEVLRQLAAKGAKAKLLNDPKQTEKASVHECWSAWQDKKKKKLETYKGKTAFAKDMLLKYDNLENQSVIVRWCGVWEKETAPS